MTTTTHPNSAILEDVYADLACIGRYAADSIVLHPADGSAPVKGKTAVERHELDLIRATGNTLVMDVEHIIANDYFGSVHGVLRAHVGDNDIAMPFCGLWRFASAVIVEHWENAYRPVELTRLLSGGSR
ncbi:hypothetical protein [Amycolatopsis taiwanensis]|uniref:SnoaL-like domain-containing protein n=1 Tax=Amycolatopsis taiwanensis TaxID=342230 RepID=A0A9W6R476_9PSEU|nr:hypothetical protein [Amycolatopsis taiwanensis]GLY68819.1 hypothetical protein Atai01_54380 [Amycolatopsis taiwanensis]